MNPIDVLRVGEAFSRPGLDTRTWFAAAVIEAIKVDANGKFADVAILPFLRKETVAIAGGGAQHGIHIPYEVGCLVLVAFPDGNADAGGVVVAGLWDQGQPVPDIVADNPDDPAWVAPAGRTLRLSVSSGGKVHLGGGTGLSAINENPALGEGVVVASAVDTFTGMTLGQLGGASTVVFAKK